MLLLLFAISPLLSLFYIDRLFFSENKSSNKLLDWILLILNISITIYILWQNRFGAEGAIVRGIVGIISFIGFLTGTLSFKKKNSKEFKLKLLITIMILLIIGFGLCTSEGLF